MSQAAELAAREAEAAACSTPQMITITRPAWRHGCGLVWQIWNEPHPAAIAEQILRGEYA